MKNRLRSGDTEWNNSQTLREGELTFDAEKKALRFYDGETLGGYEAIGVRAYEPPVGPGPQELIAGTMDAGFFGETTSEELLTYDELASQIGLSAGTSQFNDESVWLKFVLEGEILYVAKKPTRYSISWDQINAVNAVYSGGASVSVGDSVLDVTLLKGANSDPTVAGDDGDWSGYDIDLAVGSEWNRLLYHVSDGASIASGHTLASEGLTEGDWAQYSEAELLTHRDYGNGSYSWCQELSGDLSGYRVYRGGHGVSFLSRYPSSASNAHTGWRPCLRLKTA